MEDATPLWTPEESNPLTLDQQSFYSYDLDPALFSMYEFKRHALEKRFLTSKAWTTSKLFAETEPTDFPVVDSLDDVKYMFRSNSFMRFLVEKEERVYWIWFNGGSHDVSFQVATNEILTYEETKDLVTEFKAVFPEQVAVDTRVPVKFWTNSQQGPMSRTASLDVPAWTDIQSNYSKSIEDKVAALMQKRDHSTADGQMILWYGPPGTGKTYALRALISEWRDWAKFEYIVDPEQFFGPNASYLFEVIHEANESNKWKVLILEDCGEMMATDAKERIGQGFQRLLNIVDGLIGQGLKLMVFVTTNEKLEKLHPAIARPGRCFAKIEFPELTADEVAEWLKAHGVEQGDKEQTLSELYGQIGGNSQIAAKKQKSFGFA